MIYEQYGASVYRDETRSRSWSTLARSDND